MFESWRRIIFFNLKILKFKNDRNKNNWEFVERLKVNKKNKKFQDIIRELKKIRIHLQEIDLVLFRCLNVN